MATDPSSITERGLDGAWDEAVGAFRSYVEASDETRPYAEARLGGIRTTLARLLARDPGDIQNEINERAQGV